MINVFRENPIPAVNTIPNMTIIAELEITTRIYPKPIRMENPFITPSLGNQRLSRTERTYSE